MSVWLFSLGLALMVACAQQSGGGAGQASLGQEFRLKAGREAELKAARLKVRFASVSEDSRCPTGVDCIWAGNARVSLVVQRAGGKQTTVELNTNVEPKAVSADGYELALTNLDPYPQSGAKIDPKDYTATLVVRQK
ncbi:MAG TPA: hypothetical protein VEQ42_02740 [Pyrinomonadaceae bacterium]|nr:hypothetical protein [Pyrinomonadaceae bacterium]